MSKILKISQDLFDLFYPIGSYYETSNLTWTPQNAGWYGTWEEDSAGKTTVAKDTGTFATVGNTVGSETSATVNHTLSINEMPSHTHKIFAGGNLDWPLTNIWGFTTGEGIINCDHATVLNGSLENSNGNRSVYMGEKVGNGEAHNHGNVSTIQPSVVVRRWHRTA